MAKRVSKKANERRVAFTRKRNDPSKELSYQLSRIAFQLSEVHHMRGHNKLAALENLLKLVDEAASLQTAVMMKGGR